MPHQKMYASFASLGPKEEKLVYDCTVIKNKEQREKILSENNIVCIDLFSDDCEPCKIVSPKFCELAKQYNSPGKCMLVKENIDLQLTHDYKIRAVPAFIFYIKGELLLNQDKKPVHVIGGDHMAVKEILDKLIGQGF